MRARAPSHVLIALVGILGWSGGALAGELDNPSVDEVSDGGALPAGWAPDRWGTVVATFTYLAPGHQGEHALRVDLSSAGPADSGDAKWMAAPFAPEPGSDPYVLSDWYRADVPTNLLVNFTDGAGRSEWRTVASVGPALTWTQARGTIAVPSWVTLMRVAHTIATVGWLETDSFAAARAALPPPLVSITFDDGWKSAYTELVPKLDAMGMRATHFIISGFMSRVGYSDLYLTKREVVSLMRRGHEVQSHTSSHQDLVTLSPLELMSALTGSQSDIDALGAPVRGLAFPYGSYNAEVRDRAAEVYAYARKVDDRPNVLPYRVHELSATVVTNTFTTADLAETLNAAQAASGWTILVFHRAADDAPLDSFVTPQVFQSMVDLLVARRAVVKPVGEVLGVWRAPTEPLPEPSDELLSVDGGAPLPVVDDHPRLDGGVVGDAADGSRTREAATNASIADPYAIPPPHDRLDAEVYASYRTPPREKERDAIGCTAARARGRTSALDPRLLLAVALAWAASRLRRRS